MRFAIAFLILAMTGYAATRLKSPKGRELFPEPPKRLRVVPRVKVPSPLVPRLSVLPPPIRWITNTLAWDYPTNWNQVSNIILYRGNYTNFTSSNSVGRVGTVKIARTNVQYCVVTAVGTNGLESLFSNIIRVPGTNLVIHVTVSGSATNIYQSSALIGPWSAMGTTNYWVTNQFGTHYYRGRGKAGNKVTISGVWK